MPLHLAPTTRRRFLFSLSAAGAGILTLPARQVAAAEVDGDLVAILNDTHIGEKQKLDSAFPRNLKTTVAALLALEKKPAAVFVNGDIAMSDGQPGDYKLFATLIQPLRDGGMPVHLTLGNHDVRDVFYNVLSAEKPAQPPVASRHVAVIETKRANFFLLDTLQKTMIAPGDIGAEQLAWLGKALDARSDKPALLMLHHNPRFGGDPLHFPGGLIDSDALRELVVPRKHVKAYVHGHIHDWSLAMDSGVHIVNTPATSSVADPKKSTTGWTMARLRDDGMTLTTLTHAADHAWHNKAHELKWR